MFLETRRLILRRFRESDFPDFCQFATDRELCRMMGRDPAAPRLTFDWLKDKEERGYALVLKENGRVVGNLTVCPVPSDVAARDELAGKKGLSLSFSMSRAYQRRGLMLEALSATVDHLFQAEGADYVHCGYFDFNVPSRQLQEKLGFVFLSSGCIRMDEEEITCVENVLWREQWTANRENPLNPGEKA